MLILFEMVQDLGINLGMNPGYCPGLSILSKSQKMQPHSQFEICAAFSYSSPNNDGPELLDGNQEDDMDAFL